VRQASHVADSETARQLPALLGMATVRAAYLRAGDAADLANKVRSFDWYEALQGQVGRMAGLTAIQPRAATGRPLLLGGHAIRGTKDGVYGVSGR